MIYRLSISAERDRLLLKGALLFDLWFDVPHRPTHDTDFLGFGSAEIPQVEAVFRDICRIEVDDGIVFDPDSVKAAEIRKEAILCTIDPARRCLKSARPEPVEVGRASTGSARTALILYLAESITQTRHRQLNR